MSNSKKKNTSNMYADTKTWNAFKGCGYECRYCVDSFQKQAKRQKHLCPHCYNYEPHEHPERLNKIPSAKIIFVAGNADLAFARPEYIALIIEAIIRHNKRCPHKTYFLQSKCPEIFGPFLEMLPENVILLTTLETNRDEGYELMSKAPVPTERYQQFLALDYPRKVVTCEPIADFDLETLYEWIVTIAPEYVWLGYNSHPKRVNYPEPSLDKVYALEAILKETGIPVKYKTLREAVDFNKAA